MKAYEVLPLPSSRQGELNPRSFPIGALLGVCFYLREGSGRISCRGRRPIPRREPLKASAFTPQVNAPQAFSPSRIHGSPPSPSSQIAVEEGGGSFAFTPLPLKARNRQKGYSPVRVSHPQATPSAAQRLTSLLPMGQS